MISAELLQLWKSLARSDNCLDVFVPSDIRQLIGEIERLDRVIYLETPATGGHAQVAIERYRKMHEDEDGTLPARPEPSDPARNI